LGRDCVQAPIMRPQFGARRQPRRRQQMGVDLADAAPEQRVAINKAEQLVVRGDRHPRQSPIGAQEGIPQL
jgi:hypothetical protein